MTKIILITSTYPPQHTGSGILTKIVIDNLKTYEFEVFCFSSRNLPITKANDFKVKFFSDRIFSFSFWRGSFLLFKSIKSNASIIHLVTLVQPIIFITQCIRFFSKKKIILEHTLLDSGERGFLKRLYYRITYRYFFSNLKGYSQALIDQIRSYGFRGSVFKIGAPVDTSKFIVKNKHKIREDLKINYSGPNLFLFVGALSYRKGLDRILELIKVTLNKKSYNSHFLIIGPRNESTEGIFNTYQETILQAQKINLLTIIDKKIENVSDYMAASDFFIFPSRLEGFGAVLIEAMSCGCIPITSTISGVNDEFISQENGFIFPYSIINFEKIFHKAMNLDHSRREVLISNGINCAKKYSINHIKLQYDHMYKSVLKD